MKNKQLTLALVIVAVFAASTTLSGSRAYAQQNSTTTTTIVTGVHEWHPGHWQWKHGFEHPFGVLQSNNVVVVPSTTLAQSVVNQCPSTSPVLLSTGVCLTISQALYEIQTGQLALGGQVQAYGQVIVGQPTVLAAQGFQDPFALFHAYHHALREATEAQQQQLQSTIITTSP